MMIVCLGLQPPSAAEELAGVAARKGGTLVDRIRSAAMSGRVREWMTIARMVRRSINESN